MRRYIKLYCGTKARCESLEHCKWIKLCEGAHRSQFVALLTATPDALTAAQAASNVFAVPTLLLPFECLISIHLLFSLVAHSIINLIFTLVSLDRYYE